MGSPAPDMPSSNNQGGTTFEEMENQLKAEEARLLKPDLGKVTLEGDDVPEGLRGKSASEAVSRVLELERALQLSETGRQQALILAQTASRSPEPVVREPAPVAEPQITPAMVAEAMQEDPVKGVELMEKMTQQAINRAAADFGRRIEPLISGTANSAEAEAKRKYADEFEIYGDEIKATLDSLPNKNVMSTPGSWDDMIAYVRGKNPLKLFDRIRERERSKEQTDAQARERDGAGYVAAGSRAPAMVGGSVVMDDRTKEICRVLGMSEAEYIKWAKVS